MCDCMLYGVLDACESNGAIAVFSGRPDRARRLGVDRLRGRRQEIGDASSSILASVFGLIMSLSFAFLSANVSMTRMMCVLCSLDAWMG